MERVVKEVLERKPKKVLIQLPDGLKTQAAVIARELESKTGASVIIWFSSCFGACDLPLGLDVLGIDLMVQWGHNRYHKEKEIW